MATDPVDHGCTAAQSSAARTSAWSAGPPMAWVQPVEPPNPRESEQRAAEAAAAFLQLHAAT